VPRFAGDLSDFWVLNGYWSEGRRWLEAALALTKATDYTEGRALLLNCAGGIAVMQGDHSAAQAWLQEGLEIARELDARLLISQCLVALSWIAHAQRDHARAFVQLREALPIARGIDNKYEIGSILIFLGNVLRDEHEYAQAKAHYEEGLALFQEIGADFDAVDVLSWLGLLAQAQGDQSQAEDYFKKSLAGWQAMGTLQWKGVANCLEGLAAAKVAYRQFAVAIHLFGAADALREALASSARSRISAEDRHAALRVELGETLFAEEWAAGRALSVEEAVAYALALPAISLPARDLPGPLSFQAKINPGGLSVREVEVLQLLAQGLTYVQIADKLVVSRRTVNTHVSSIYSKLAVHSRAAATRFAIDHHLV
jgi:DNA-binding NarL/FixJ family response regulator